MGFNAEVREYLHLSEAGEGERTHSIDLLELFMCWIIICNDRKNEVGMGSEEIFMAKCAKYKMTKGLWSGGAACWVLKAASLPAPPGPPCG